MRLITRHCRQERMLQLAERTTDAAREASMREWLCTALQSSAVRL